MLFEKTSCCLYTVESRLALRLWLINISIRQLSTCQYDKTMSSKSRKILYTIHTDPSLVNFSISSDIELRTREAYLYLTSQPYPLSYFY